MRRRVEALKPFTFQSDFSPPDTSDPDLITLSAGDLAAVLADTREGTAKLIHDETLSAQTARLETIGAELRAALSSIVNLAKHLETAAIDEHDRRTALENVRHLARTLIDNQGELFSKSELHSLVGNHSD